MRRGFVLMTALSAVLALSIAPSHASSVLQGKSCKIAGKVFVQGGQRHICTLIARKLIWKVATVRTPAKRPAAVLPGSPSTAPAVQEPVRPAGPASFRDLVAKYEGISYAAWSNARSAILESSPPLPQYRLVLGPNSSLTMNNLETATRFVSRMHPGIQSPTDLTILAFNYQDRDWAKTQMDLIMPSAGSSWITYTACATQERCWGGGAFSDNRGRVLLVITTDFDDENHRSGTLAAHEFTHVLQLAALRDETVWPRPNSWPPSWLWEGHANHSQYAAMYHMSFEQYERNIRGSARELVRLNTAEPKFLMEFFQATTPTAWQERYPSWWQYELGAHFVEALSSLKGPSGISELWTRIGETKNFKVAFEQTYGLSYEEALPIIAEAIAKRLQSLAN